MQNPSKLDAYKIFDNLIVGVQLISPDFRYLYINKTACNQGKTSATELLGFKMKDVYPDIEKTNLYSYIQKCLDIKQNFDITNEFTHNDGTVEYFQLRLQPVAEGVLIMSLDVTREKQQEQILKETNQKLKNKFDEYERELLQKNRLFQELSQAKEEIEQSEQLKTEFIRNLSHEIRTPMNGILGFSSLLKTSNLTEKQINYLDMVINNGKLLVKTIDDLLELSSLMNKQSQLEIKKTNLNTLLMEIFSSFDPQAKEKRIPLYLYKEQNDEESFIYTDKQKLKKILTKLLDNALKFTVEGFIEFGYHLKQKEIEFYIKDTGIGIHADKQNMIFEKFSQEDNTLSKSIGGLGLGLTIVKESLDLFGGKISLQSEKNEGSTFSVTIPYNPVIETQKSSAEKQLANQPIEYIILIVEDEQINYLYLDTVLKSMDNINCKTLHAKNGKESVDYCKYNTNIALVLMDIKMPIMDGFEATQQIRKFRKELPIIAQTAYSNKEDKEKAFHLGCNDFLSKPIQKSILIETVLKYCTNQCITRFQPANNL